MAFRNLPEMPCGPILELYGQRKRFHVPYGLKRLIEEMTREVLRFQPENIYDFLAGFMDSRLQRKLAEEAKGQTLKGWQQHRWSWERGSVLEPEELKEFLEQLPAPVEEVNHHAVVIQAAFRGYQARKKVKQIRKSLAGNEDKQDGLVGELQTSDEKKGSKSSAGKEGSNRGSKEKRHSIEEITPETATEEELRSAVIIQAAFRGMHARNEVKKLRVSVAAPKQDEQPEVETDKPSEVTPAETNAEEPAETGEEAAPKPSEEVEAEGGGGEVPTTNDDATPANQTMEEATIEPQVESANEVNPPAEEEHEGPPAPEAKEGEEQPPAEEAKE